MPDDPAAAGPRANPFLAGLRGRCGWCGEGAAFDGYLSVRPACPVCGTEFAFAGDGPAVFVMLLVGALVVPAALVLELAAGPPTWVHAVVWLPITAGLCVALLRPVKGLLVAFQSHHRAEEARFDDA